MQSSSPPDAEEIATGEVAVAPVDAATTAEAAATIAADATEPAGPATADPDEDPAPA